MTCNKVQNMITPFINNKLSIKEMDEFLQHIDSCANCSEELEFYYTLLTAMKQLDEDKNLSTNFKNDLATKINRAEDRILHAKYTYYRKITILIVAILTFAFILSIRYVEVKEEPNVLSKEHYTIIRMFRDERADYVNAQLELYYSQQGIDVVPLPIIDYNKQY
jgi:hypothetical protein